MEKNKSKGLGDTIAKITKATGIKKVVDKVSKVTGKDCGCGERQNIYQRVIGKIEDKKEKEIIHCLFQDLSDKLLDNIKEEELKK